MRRRFRYDRATDRMVEIAIDDAVDGLPMVHGDLAPFRSPLDGTVVEGRRAYEEHMRRHNVVPFEAGCEKTTTRARPAQDKQAMRERLWQYVDTAIQRGPKGRGSN